MTTEPEPVAGTSKVAWTKEKHPDCMLLEEGGGSHILHTHMNIGSRSSLKLAMVSDTSILSEIQELGLEQKWRTFLTQRWEFENNP